MRSLRELAEEVCESLELATWSGHDADTIETALRQVRREALEKAATTDPLEVECGFCHAKKREPCWLEGPSFPHHTRWAAAIRALADAPEGVGQ